MAVNIPKLEYDLGQARKRLKGLTKPTDRETLEAKIKVLEAAIKAAKAPNLVVPEPEPVALLEVPALTAEATPSPPQVAAKTTATKSRRRPIPKITFGARVHGEIMKDMDALHARAVPPCRHTARGARTFG